jgi:hypothetical protein
MLVNILRRTSLLILTVQFAAFAEQVITLEPKQQLDLNTVVPRSAAARNRKRVSQDRPLWANADLS